MELEGFKSAWQRRTVENHPLSSGARVSRSVQFLRASAIRDVQRSQEVSRLVFCFLFALVAIGVSIVVMSPGAGRVAAWLLAAALLVDGVTGIALLARRFRAPATSTVLEFVRREYRQVETRLRLERYARRLVFALGAIALLILIFGPGRVDVRDNPFDIMGRMAIVTAFLGLAWRRAKSRSMEVRRELEHYLKELEG
jgi:hypothetical protein